MSKTTHLDFLLYIPVAFIILALCTWPKYKTYNLKLNAVEAEWNKQILIEENQATALIQAKEQIIPVNANSNAKIEHTKAKHKDHIERVTTADEANNNSITEEIH